MRTSEQTQDLAGALAKAQAAMKPASKDANNPFFKSSYATLASVWEACRGPLTANGLSILQDVTTGAEAVEVTTRLAHNSGQWIEFGPLSVPLLKRDPQTVGSAISYGKRYALSAAVGIATEDDDGEAAMGRNGHKEKEKPKEPEEKRAANGLTDADIEQIATLSKRAGYQKHGDLRPVLMEIGGVETLRQLDRRFLGDLVNHLEAKANAH